jgi:hypothetical protein
LTTKLSILLFSIEDPIPGEGSFEKRSEQESEVSRLLQDVKNQMSGELQPNRQE